MNANCMRWTMASTLMALAMAACALPLGGCDGSNTPPKSAGAAGGAADHDHDHDGHDHDEHDGHDHGASEAQSHGAKTALGEQQAGGMTIAAARFGALPTGAGELPVNARVAGGSAKVHAVRFWIGARDGAGAMKAKAALEEGDWHAHVEVPAAVAAGSQLWVDIELEGGAKETIGFELGK